MHRKIGAFLSVLWSLLVPLCTFSSVTSQEVSMVLQKFNNILGHDLHALYPKQVYILDIFFIVIV